MGFVTYIQQQICRIDAKLVIVLTKKKWTRSDRARAGKISINQRESERESEREREGERERERERKGERKGESKT